MKKKHEHKTFQIITKYFMDQPARVLSACCDECGEVNLRLKDFMQERENAAFKLYGEKSPYVIINGKTLTQQALVDAKDPRIEDLSYE